MEDRLFERYQGGEKALLVNVCFPHEDSDADEFQVLATASGVSVLAAIDCHRVSPDPKFYVGSGKAALIRDAVHSYQADVVIVNQDLSPGQEKHLERCICCRVLSRSGLILAIFAQRARTFEGKLQVELAQLQHWQTRLIRGWSHLERQKGGIGLRGPGETQLELDRRMIRVRMKIIRARLAGVRRQRAQNRQARQKSQLPLVSLVGYTNAGKSTLFNRLTGSDTLAEDKLFATLDPLMRRVSLPNGRAVILADTVGFLQRLPHALIEAFKATLEETRAADLIIRVVDLADPHFRHHQTVIDEVLAEVGADQCPTMTVYNKIDYQGMSATRQSIDKVEQIWLSAVTGEGVALLLEAIAEHFMGQRRVKALQLSPCQGRLRARLYEMGAVLSDSVEEQGGWRMSVALTEEEWLVLSSSQGNSDPD